MGNGRVSLLTAVIFLVAGIAVATEEVENRAVARRMAVMVQADAAIDLLSGMMGGRILFDRTRASEARRALIKAMGEVDSRFRRQRTDRLSHARPSIWTQWPDFKARARAAEQAARAISVRSPERLGQTLPVVIQACLACHNTYRSPVDQLGRSYRQKQIPESHDR